VLVFVLLFIGVSDSQLIHPSGQYALETHPFKRAASLCLLRNPNIEIVPVFFD
jgi:hypothetical protein